MGRPRYFPVTTTPLRMQAGLQRFPTDFGNGPVDDMPFQIDAEWQRYVDNKAALSRRGDAVGRRHGLIDEHAGHAAAHREVNEWIQAAIQRDHPGFVPRANGERETSDPYAPWLDQVQEDAAVVYCEADGSDRTILMHVHAPSGWRPERLLGASFSAIHHPVPNFVDDPRAAASMVAAMVERGPYVRFVWTVAADDVLDHHPEFGHRAPWPSATRGWLRVERQLTIPFPNVRASLFIIRTYLYDFAELSTQEHATLRHAIAAMPSEIAAYKGLESGRPQILALLDPR